ncbi:SDR family oxidoreductase [Streptosporangium carneum]|uniref:Nucleotide-diphosphate-sugar epimerase n=1 Tax=Streptosporangium carneum TaxID=47481 RepID=A0A9W6I119_9ACTN|nr:NAD(P)H-binding protein [Streptosporangium carneum]GLK09005.1 nucleotide-diphosphate-sugar epimerase [Streptosporangium carneum]
MILVTGATSNVGREVVGQLAAAGREVRAFTRDPDRVADIGPSVKTVTGDLAQPETLRAALAGVERVFALSGGGPEQPLHDANLAQAAAEAGVRHVVKMSVIGAEYGFGDLMSTWHLAGERAIRQVGLPWTFLRPGEFMSNARLWAATVKSQGVVYWPHGHVKVAVIDPRDIAALAVAALTSPGHEGKAYRISGPEALTVGERVGTLGAALGRALRHVEIPVSAARDAAARAGRQPLVVETALTNMGSDDYRVPYAQVLPVSRDVLGREPRTFAEWAADHIGLFR